MRVIKESLAGIGGLLFFVAILIIPVLFIMGAEWASEHILPWASALSVMLFIIEITIVLPLSIPRKTRMFASKALINFSYVFGITLWMDSLLLTLNIWGVGAVIIGFLLAGVGVVPVAFLACMFNGLWAFVVELTFLVIITYANRLGAFSLASSLEQEI